MTSERTPKVETGLAGRDGEAPLGPPRTRALLRWLHRAGAARYRYRLIQGLCISLVVNQCALLALGKLANGDDAGHVGLLASTVYWTIGIGLFAGWVLLGGWFDVPTRALFEELAVRRGYSRPACLRFEVFAGWRWMASWLALPSVCCALFADLRPHTLSALGASLVNLLLCLVLVELIAIAIVVGTVTLRRFEIRTARSAWLAVCVLPELIRPILPGFPSVRGLATALEQIILRWGVTG